MVFGTFERRGLVLQSQTFIDSDMHCVCLLTISLKGLENKMEENDDFILMFRYKDRENEMDQKEEMKKTEFLNSIEM